MPPSALPCPLPRRRVVIIDDHTAIIEMLQQVIEMMPGYKVIGSAEDTAAALELCRREQPDLVVLDLMMPPSSGLALLAELWTVCAQARVLIFSGHLHAASIEQALSSGAHGLVEKMAGLREFRQALLAVDSGRVYFCRSASDAIRDIVSLKFPGPGQADRLSEREKTVLRALAEGLSSKEISSRLGISVHTVVNHRTRLMKKTGLRGVAQLSRYAVQLGLVESVVELGESS